jgi:endo-1,4-beta-xylanase
MNMKTSGIVNFRGMGKIFLLIVMVLISASSCKKKTSSLDESIAKYRKGELIVQAKKGSKVSVEQLRHEFWFGAAIPNSFVRGMSESDLKQFKEHFLMNFNCAVPENSMKWITMERTQGKPQYAVTDSILKWCDENNLPVRGHNIFWGKTKYIQPWLIKMNDEELKKALQYRAESIAKYYKGRFAEYDLNNEMLDENYYETRLGPEITKEMAEWVRNADPDAKIFLNEHDIFLPLQPAGNKLAICMALIRKLLSQGVKIDGIGIQGHSHLLTFDRQALKDGLDSLAKFNIPIRITEFNMPGRGYPADEKRFPLTPEQETAKAKEITDFYRICFAHPAVEGILMWGFWEGANWIQASSLYKRDWTPNPAADAYRNLVFNEWWTKTEGTAGSDGIYSTPAFFGKYKVTVDGVSKTVDLNKKDGKMTVDFR